MRFSFSKFVYLVVGISVLFSFLAWRESRTLWILKKEFYEETKYDLEKERIKMGIKEPPYELVGGEMFIKAGLSLVGSFEVPPLPEIKRIPFVIYRIEGKYGRGVCMAISVDKLSRVFTMGFNSFLKAGISRGGSFSLNIRGEFFSKHKEPILKLSPYVVKPGDTLWDIAKKFNITLDTIISANDLKSVDLLKIGQVIKVPNVSGVFHKVGKDESLEKIAKTYNVDIEHIKKYNEDIKELKVGTLVFIPGGKLLEEKQPSRPRWLASRGTSQRFIWPLEGTINSDFGWRRDPLSKRREFHSGIDIDGSAGEYVRASRAGRVVYAGWQSGYGLLIVIDHGDGWETWYAHCSRINVREGQYVRQGEIIGRVGSTGRTTGSHLHFEIRNNGRPVNPLYYLR
ncbi:MAG: M23 family metallopeptidase [Synergistetes bacterium]|nr:M23 family metallopeptidase [Synergistota bacterium]MCX8127962.1 M23 family metallopeptidase [Synergistota bacterium]MDW8191997.1 M23 family metallopeptidase [Synergistota bacterium]